MVANNILHILKTLHSEGYITVNASDEEIQSILEEFDLTTISTENFFNENDF